MKIHIAQISLGKRKVKEKLDRLNKRFDNAQLDILDGNDSIIYQARIPVHLRARGRDVEMTINCDLKLNNNIRYAYLNVYADLTKPLLVTLLIGLAAGSASYLLGNSIYGSIFIAIFGMFFSSFMIFIPVKRQIDRKVRDWIKKDL